jgi:hypothetical protein
LALLRIYTAAYATLLSENVCNATFAPAAAGGVLTLNAISAATAVGAGTAAVARILTAGAVMQIEGMTVGTAATDVILDSTSISIGQTVSITGATITEGNA